MGAAAGASAQKRCGTSLPPREEPLRAPGLPCAGWDPAVGAGRGQQRSPCPWDSPAGARGPRGGSPESALGRACAGTARSLHLRGATAATAVLRQRISSRCPSPAARRCVRLKSAVAGNEASLAAPP